MGAEQVTSLIYTCDREGCPTEPLDVGTNLVQPVGWIQISYPYPQRWICGWGCLSSFAKEQKALSEEK